VCCNFGGVCVGLQGGREKSPAAFCRKVLTSKESIEMWGDGLQTRRHVRAGVHMRVVSRLTKITPHSFTFIDDCVEGILRMTKSDFREPLNIGSDEMIAMNDMMKLAASFEGKDLPFKHIPGPEGVRGRNSNNELIKEKLGWAPSISLKDGLKVTYFWIKGELSKETGPADQYASSTIVGCTAPIELGQLRTKLDGEEFQK
jgi:GDP-D-mannose 3',5'-epimerase